MNVCIVGDGLTSLSLAKNLIKKKINVHIYQQKKINRQPTNRTIGISRKNFEFFNKDIEPFKKMNAWEINKIEIFSEKIKSGKILNFEKKNSSLFYMIRNDQLYRLLNNKLSKSKFFKKIFIKENNFYQKILKDKKYDLIINCDPFNHLAKKYFYKKIEKDYANLAYTVILKHEKLNNKTASQVFTKFGPIAFLPISNTETSIVCSLDVKNYKYNKKEILDLIKKYNLKLKIKKFLKLESFKLQSASLRNYYYKNILMFGDSLHKIHPLAGQGFNMTIRDINTLSDIIQNKIDLGMTLDTLIFDEFEKKSKHVNFIFSSAIDFIYEFFNFDKKNKNESLSKVLKLLGKNKKINSLIVKYADNGLSI